MATRDEYIAKLKQQLDQWNAEVAKWEDKAKQAGSGVKAEYDKHIVTVRQQRDQAMEQMKRVQAASGDAWKELMSGTDEAWGRMRDAFNRAREHFKKDPTPKP
jgi:hypothetical protein